MKDFNLKKECEKEEFDYSGFWEDKEEESIKKKVDELPKGLPRKGLKGKYLKKKNHVGRNQLKRSWNLGRVEDD